MTVSASEPDHLEPKAALRDRLGVDERVAERRRTPRSASPERWRPAGRRSGRSAAPRRPRPRPRSRPASSRAKIAITSATIANTASTISALPCRSAPPWAQSGSAPGGVKSNTVMSSDANRQIAAAITASGQQAGRAATARRSLTFRLPGPCASPRRRAGRGAAGSASALGRGPRPPRLDLARDRRGSGRAR